MSGRGPGRRENGCRPTPQRPILTESPSSSSVKVVVAKISHELGKHGVCQRFRVYETRRMKMRHISWAASAICWLALLTGGQAQAQPPEPQEKPAAADDDRPPRLTRRRKPGRKAEKTLTVTGVVASFHKSRDGRRRWSATWTANGGAISSERKLTGVVSLKDRVTIEGWTHSGESEIHAATIKNEASGKVVDVDKPPPENSAR